MQPVDSLMQPIDSVIVIELQTVEAESDRAPWKLIACAPKRADPRLRRQNFSFDARELRASAAGPDFFARWATFLNPKPLCLDSKR